MPHTNVVNPRAAFPPLPTSSPAVVRMSGLFSPSQPNPRHFGSWCNSHCSCALSDFDPICSVVDDVTFFNPCFAGCTARSSSSSHSSHSSNSSLSVDFETCSCLTSVEGGGGGGAGGGPAVKGYCESAKCDYLYFSLFVFFQVFFTFAATMPGLVASLR